MLIIKPLSDLSLQRNVCVRTDIERERRVWGLRSAAVDHSSSFRRKTALKNASIVFIIQDKISLMPEGCHYMHNRIITYLHCKKNCKNRAQCTVLIWQNVTYWFFFTGVLTVYWMLHFIALCFTVNRNVH